MIATRSASREINRLAVGNPVALAPGVTGGKENEQIDCFEEWVGTHRGNCCSCGVGDIGSRAGRATFTDHRSGHGPYYEEHHGSNTIERRQQIRRFPRWIFVSIQQVVRS